MRVPDVLSVMLAGETNRHHHHGHQVQQEEDKGDLPPRKTRPSSFELLKSHGKGFKRLRVRCSRESTSADDQVSDFTASNTSVEEMLRIAGERYLHFSELKYDDFSMVMHPFGYALSGITEDETKDVELFHLLLAAAEKVTNQQWDRACRLLARCEWMSSNRSNPAQRVVHLFAEALRERIDNVVSATSPNVNEREKDRKSILDNGLGTSATHLRLYQKLQFLHVTYFAGIQAIVEEVASARNIHILDLEIRSGVQWTIFMQAIADQRRGDDCPVESLTITAVHFSGDKSILEATGKRLLSFAESLNLPLFFKVASFPRLKGPRAAWATLMGISPDETVVVFAPLILRTMLVAPSSLEMLMRVIKSWNPSLMVLIEVEANHNVANFDTRFIEALFFYSALFDCVDSTCVGEDTELREKAEEVFSGGIWSMVVKEQEERVVRSVKLDVWREFFSKFRMVEQQTSESAFYQARLVIRELACSDSYTLQKNEKSIVVGWKGTPINSLSAWKFSKERGRCYEI